jgi:hypothetical protein
VTWHLTGLEAHPSSHTENPKRILKGCEPMRDRNLNVRLETGGLWYVGWLFTVAFAKLSFWQAILATIAWPYYLGLVIRG